LRSATLGLVCSTEGGAGFTKELDLGIDERLMFCESLSLLELFFGLSTSPSGASGRETIAVVFFFPCNNTNAKTITTKRANPAATATPIINQCGNPELEAANGHHLNINGYVT